jgi:hypothetical protein
MWYAGRFMRFLFLLTSSLVIGGCGGSVLDVTPLGDSGTSDGSNAALESDAAVNDAGNAAAERDAGPLACPGPIDDAGFASLAELPISALCASGSGRLLRWTTPCDGSIAVVQPQGSDCLDVWLFDATTQTLQATASGCDLHAACTGSVAGFDFPTACFDGSISPQMTELCGEVTPPIDGGDR